MNISTSCSYNPQNITDTLTCSAQIPEQQIFHAIGLTLLLIGIVIFTSTFIGVKAAEVLKWE